MRVATFAGHSCKGCARYFNPRHPCGWRQMIYKQTVYYRLFQSTPPVRVATALYDAAKVYADISIHATRAGGDQNSSRHKNNGDNFNPRHPCGWRPARGKDNSKPMQFQSTPPVRVATFAGHSCKGCARYFNPRHPCGWRLGCKWRNLMRGKNFNPRHPCGWRLIQRVCAVD